jgi:6-phosphogluconate dehydrogenase
MNNRTFGIIGLGKMGGSLAMQATDKKYGIVGYDSSQSTKLENEGLQLAKDLNELVAKLPLPRIIFIYIPAGEAVDKLLDSLTSILSEGDIIVDGGNSYWGDSIRRAEKLNAAALYLIDCGTSGGVEGARNGACFMAGGDPAAMEFVTPILKDLAVPKGFVYTGLSGSGHFVKLVHNGIEFGMLQAIGEGMDLLSHYRSPLDYSEILSCWNNGSVIRSWLIELMGSMYDEKKSFSDVPSYIEDTGEVNWLVNDALHMEVPIPVIGLSVMQLLASREKDQTWAKAIAMMRRGFGGHPFGENQGIKHERHFGRVGDFPKLISTEKQVKSEASV